MIKTNGNLMNTLQMSDEAHFDVSGYLNKHNCHYSPRNNPHELHQRPVHSAKVRVWCEVYSHDIIGPYFLENEEGPTVTLNAEQYKVMVATFLSIELHPR
jgi:hypothetical protein